MVFSTTIVYCKWRSHHNHVVPQVVVASTDYDGAQAEKRRIVALAGPTVEGWYLLAVDSPLNYTHWGGHVPTGVPGVNFPQVLESAFV